MPSLLYPALPGHALHSRTVPGLTMPRPTPTGHTLLSLAMPRLLYPAKSCLAAPSRALPNRTRPCTAEPGHTMPCLPGRTMPDHVVPSPAKLHLAAPSHAAPDPAKPRHDYASLIFNR